ncbi:MAG: hypothetical protein IIU78_06555 [Alistipes sp.]|nr:hypothetical protein [Alistipes sp.]
MNYKNITEKLKRVAAIVDSWQHSNAIPQIERDIALGELREVYNELLVLDGDSTSVEEAESNVADVEGEGVVTEEDSVAEEQLVGESERDPFYDALDIDALLGLSDEPHDEQPEPIAKENVEEAEPEPIAETEVAVEPTPEPEPIIEPTAEPEVVAEPVANPAEEQKVDVAKSLNGGLFDLNDIPVRSKSKRKMISLYSDNPIASAPSQEKRAEAPKVVEQQSEAPVQEVAKIEVEPSEPVQRLGDSFAGVTTLADKMAQDDAPTTPFNRIKDLRSAIGLNDKFLMVRDLFGGDAERYEATIDTLDEFDDLDECIIYIVENFRWNPDLEASKLLVSLIERKLA